MSPRGAPPEVWAGGAVLWRPGDGGEPEVALVHRPRYDDWSLPKGKLDPGEHLVACARREVREETGFDCVLGRPLGEQRYPVTERDGRPAEKVVRYWAARAAGGEFVPNEEVDELAWLPPGAAAERLTHARDRDLVATALEHPDAVAVLLVRHASAGSRSAWDGDDRLRPLDDKGRRQAHALCEVLPAFGPERVSSADLVRCVDTVRPLADLLGLPVTLEPTLDDGAYADDPARALARLDAIAAEGRPAVVCSQGGAVPGLVGAALQRGGLPDGGVEAKKGSAWSLVFAGGRLVDAEYFPRLVADGAPG